MKINSPMIAPRSSKTRVGQLTNWQRRVMYHFLGDGEKVFFGIRNASDVYAKFPTISVNILLAAKILMKRRVKGTSDQYEMFLTGHGKRLLMVLDYMRYRRQVRA